MKKTITLTLLLFSLFSFSQPGSLVTCFNSGIARIDNGITINDTKIQPDGKILIGGSFTSSYIGEAKNCIAPS